MALLFGKAAERKRGAMCRSLRLLLVMSAIGVQSNAATSCSTCFVVLPMNSASPQQIFSILATLPLGKCRKRHRTILSVIVEEREDSEPSWDEGCIVPGGLHRAIRVPDCAATALGCLFATAFAERSPSSRQSAQPGHHQRRLVSSTPPLLEIEALALQAGLSAQKVSCTSAAAPSLQEERVEAAGAQTTAEAGLRRR